MIDYQIVSTESTKDMDVTLSWDTIFGVLNAARKYMVEDAARAGVWCMAEVICSRLALNFLSRVYGGFLLVGVPPVIISNDGIFHDFPPQKPAISGDTPWLRGAWEDLELTCRRWIALEARAATGAVGACLRILRSLVTGTCPRNGD